MGRLFSLFLLLLPLACGKVEKGGDNGGSDGGNGGDGDGAPAGMQRLTVSVEGGGAVTSDPPGIECPETCTADFDEGIEVTLTTTPNSDSGLAGWSGDCTGLAPTCALTMDASRTAEVRFGLHGSKRWVNHLSFPGQDFLFIDVVLDADGNPIFSGEVEQEDGGGWDLYVVKFDKMTGEVIWQNQVMTAISVYVGGLAVDPEGNVYAAMSILGFDPVTIAGTTVTPDLFGNIVVLRMAAADGDIEWVKQWGGDGQDRPHALAVGGGFLWVAGETSSSNADFDGNAVVANSGDAFIAKASLANGTAGRVKHLDGNFELFSIAATATKVGVAGEFRAAATIDAGCGISLNGSNASDGLVADFRVSDLDCQWAQDFGDLDPDMDAFAFGIAAHPDGGWVATGGFEGNVLWAEEGSSLGSRGGFDAFAVRYAANGSHVWSFRYGDTGSDIGTAIATAPDGATFLTGSFAGDITFGGFELSGPNDAYVTRMSPGNTPSHEWAVALGGDSTDRPEGLAADADGYVYVGAYFNGMTNVDGEVFTAQDYDAFLGALIR